MQSPLVVIPFADDPAEAARLIDDAAFPLASILDPGPLIEIERFRDDALSLALEYEGVSVGAVLFTARWGGGGVMIT